MLGPWAMSPSESWHSAALPPFRRLCLASFLLPASTSCHSFGLVQGCRRRRSGLHPSASVVRCWFCSFGASFVRSTTSLSWVLGWFRSFSQLGSFAYQLTRSTIHRQLGHTTAAAAISHIIYTSPSTQRKRGDTGRSQGREAPLPLFSSLRCRVDNIERCGPTSSSVGVSSVYCLGFKGIAPTRSSTSRGT